MPPEEQHALINTCQPPVLRLYPWCLDGWAVENLADHESVDTKGHQQSFPGLPCPPVGRVSGATLYKNIPQVEGKLQDSWWKTWAIFKQLKLWNYICTLSSRRKKKKTNHQQTKSILKNAFLLCGWLKNITGCPDRLKDSLREDPVSQFHLSWWQEHWEAIPSLANLARDALNLKQQENLQAEKGRWSRKLQLIQFLDPREEEAANNSGSYF